MKRILKVTALFVLPLGMAAMFGNAIISIGDHYNLFEAGQNYLPFVCALSFFAFLFFFCMTANLIYPANVVVLPIKREIEPIQPADANTAAWLYYIQSNKAYSLNL